MFKRCLLVMITSFVLLLPFRAESGNILAPPIPARIGGTVTVDGAQLTQDTDDDYSFKVTREDGTDYLDLNNDPAQDTDGLNSSDWYVIDIPIYDATDQPGGADPGDAATIHVYKDGTELTVASPTNGEFAVGESGSTAQIDLEVISNQSPMADAGADQTVDEGVTVTLDGSNSSDPDGDDDIVSYLWEQIEGITVTLSGTAAVQPTFTSPDVGADGVSLTFELTVEDYGGLTDTDTCIVNVTWENQPPTADAGLDQTVNEGDTVTLDGANSSDPDDGIASYLWEQTVGTSVTLDDPTAVQPTFTAPDVGADGESLTFQLTVTDYGGLKGTDTCVVNITSVGGDGGGGGGGGGGCPIEIAAFGSPFEGLVEILRQFRDAFLLPTRLGRTFVAAYYRYSPPVADLMAGHEGLRAIVRWSLLPLVGVSWVALEFGPTTVLALMLLLSSGLVGIAGFSWKKLRK